MNWLKNPYVITLLVIITLLVVVIVGSAIAALVLSGKYKRRKVTPTTPTKSSGWFWKLVVWIFIIGAVCFVTIGVIRHKKQQVPQVTTTSKSVTERRWVLTWRKLPQTMGVNANIRKKSLSAAVLKCDRFEFKIIGYYDNHGTTDTFIMYWDKAANPDFGNWSQKTPPLQGSWFLEPVSDNLFTGWVRNTKGEESSLWLRAVD